MKMKLKLKRFFNLIEVSLAMGVTAVGILGAITILPIALKTTAATSYSAYLSDASNMIFAGIDNFLNEECYTLDYEEAHKGDVTAEKLQEIYTKRRRSFKDIFPDNVSGSINLNAGLDFSNSATSSSGVYVVLEKRSKGDGKGNFFDPDGGDINDNHGLIAFYPESYSKTITLPETYTERFPADIGRPLFVARYRIIVTDLENDSEFKMDGLRGLEEAETEKTIIDIYDRTGKKTETATIEGIRVARTRRFLYLNDKIELDENEKKEKERRNEENKLMKRVYVEFSWPYNAEYKSRSKKTFVKEYYMVD